MRRRRARPWRACLLALCLVLAAGVPGRVAGDDGAVQLGAGAADDPAVRSLLNSALAASDPAALAAAAAAGGKAAPDPATADAVLAAVRGGGAHHTVGDDVRAALAVARRDPAALAAAVAALAEGNGGASSTTTATPPSDEDAAIAVALDALTDLLDVDLDAAAAVARAPGAWADLAGVVRRGVASLEGGQGSGAAARDASPPVAAATAACGVLSAATRNDADAAAAALTGAPGLAHVLVAAVRVGAGVPAATPPPRDWEVAAATAVRWVWSLVAGRAGAADAQLPPPSPSAPPPSLPPPPPAPALAARAMAALSALAAGPDPPPRSGPWAAAGGYSLVADLIVGAVRGGDGGKAAGATARDTARLTRRAVALAADLGSRAHHAALGWWPPRELSLAGSATAASPLAEALTAVVVASGHQAGGGPAPADAVSALSGLTPARRGGGVVGGGIAWPPRLTPALEALVRAGGDPDAVEAAGELLARVVGGKGGGGGRGSEL